MRYKSGIWKKIETAPKDGTRVELLNKKNNLRDIGKWCDYTNRGWLGPNRLAGEWTTDYGNGEMTHWRPINGKS